MALLMCFAHPSQRICRTSSLILKNKEQMLLLLRNPNKSRLPNCNSHQYMKNNLLFRVHARFGFYKSSLKKKKYIQFELDFLFQLQIIFASYCCYWIWSDSYITYVFFLLLLVLLKIPTKLQVLIKLLRIPIKNFKNITICHYFKQNCPLLARRKKKIGGGDTWWSEGLSGTGGGWEMGGEGLHLKKN